MRPIVATVMFLAALLGGARGLWHVRFPDADVLGSCSYLTAHWADRLASLAWLPFILLGLGGWAESLRRLFLRGASGPWTAPAAFCASVFFTVMALFGLAVNGVMTFGAVSLFFAVGAAAALRHWDSQGALRPSIPGRKAPAWARVALVSGAALYLLEALAPPVAWDAVADHFYFAGEAARTGWLPPGWASFNGLMPKAGDLFLSGLWCLGGESLAHLGLLIPAAACCHLVGEAAHGWGGERWTGCLVFLGTPFFLPLFASGYVEGFVVWPLFASFLLLAASDSEEAGKPLLAASAFLAGCALSAKYTALFGVLGWTAAYAFLRPRPGGKWRLGLPILFLLPVFPWFLRTTLATGDPVFPLLTGWFGMPPGFNAGMIATILKETIPPDWHDPWMLARGTWKNLFTDATGVGAPLGVLLLAPLPWALGRGTPRRSAAAYWLVLLASWASASFMLRHAAVAVLALAALSAVGLKRILERGRFRAVLAAVVLSAVSMAGLALFQFAGTRPFGPALGLEAERERLVLNHYMDGESLSAFRWVERHTGPRDKVLLFTHYLAFPLGRGAVYDFQWENPVLLRWASESGGADALARRLKREGVEAVLYLRGESASLAGYNRKFDATGLDDREWEAFWSRWMRPALVLEDAVVYLRRDAPAEGAAPLLDLPGPQDKAFAEARRTAVRKGDPKGAAVRLGEFLERHPSVAGAHLEQGVWLAVSGDGAGARTALERAAFLGARQIRLCEWLSGMHAKDAALKARWEREGDASALKSKMASYL